MPASSSKAANILRASLAGQAASNNDNDINNNNHHGAGGRPSHRRSNTHDTIDANYDEAVNESIELDCNGDEGDYSTPLTSSVHGIHGTVAGDRHIGAYDLGSIALSNHSPGGSSHSSSSPRRATSFLSQVSVSNATVPASNGSKKKPLGSCAASHHLDDPIPYENSTEDNVRHGSGLLARCVHSRRLVCIAVAALALLGVIIGVSVDSASNKNRTGDPNSSHASGWLPGGGLPGWMPDMGDKNNEEEEDEEGIHGYYPEPTKPEDEPATTTSTTTTSATSSPPPPAEQQPAQTTAAATWLPTLYFEEPMLSTLGSALSFSDDGTHLAISAHRSDIIQVMKRNLDGTWSHVGATLPGKVAALSGDGTRIAVADASESTVTTYENVGGVAGTWERYGPTLTHLWGARAVSLDYDGTTLAISHHPDSICRVCPSVATVYELQTEPSLPGWEDWFQEDDMIGAYDFDFSVSLSSDGNTLAFSGRVYENAVGVWNVKSNFPDFISSHSALSGDGGTAAVSLPDCHIFKTTDPTETGCTNTEKHEVSVMEYQPSNGGWWNRKGISIGPEIAAHLGTTSMVLSEDGNTIAIAVGGRGEGGEAAIDVGGALGGGDALGDSSLGGAAAALYEPMPLDDDEAIDELPLDSRGDGNVRRRLQKKQQQGRDLDEENWSEDWTKYDAYEMADAFVRVYRYDESTGDWSTVGDDLPVETSGATVAVSSDGSILAVGVPYGGSDDSGYVKVYELMM